MPELRHILSADQFEEDFLLRLFRNADTFRDLFFNEAGDGRSKLRMLLRGRLMKYIFFEPSSRTRMSFQDGAFHLGMHVSGTDLADRFSSFAKWEEVEPAFRTMSGYGTDVIVVRSKNAGEVARAAKFSRSPVINAGDGSAEHPTQALLDLYTIWLEYGRLNNLVIGLGGDLLYGRTVHSLIQILSKFEGNSFILVSPPEVSLPDNYKQLLADRGCKFTEIHDVQEAMPLADFWYWTRVQFERVEDEELKQRLFAAAKAFAIGVKELELMRETAILMHPQPIDRRIWEVRQDTVWSGMLPIKERQGLFRKVRIFEQSDNGLWSRMALIFWVVTGTHQHHLG